MGKRARASGGGVIEKDELLASMTRELAVFIAKLEMCRDDAFISFVIQEIARVTREISMESRASMVAILSRLTEDQLISLNDSVTIRKHEKSATVLAQCIFERIQTDMENKQLALSDLKERLSLVGKMLLTHVYYAGGAYDCGSLTKDIFATIAKRRPTGGELGTPKGGDVDMAK